MCHYFIYVWYIDCTSCTRPISINLVSMEASEYGLTRGTCFFARHLKVVAVARLMCVVWCVFGWAVFFRALHEFAFSNTYTTADCERPRAVSVD